MPVVIADITGGEPLASEFRKAAGENLYRLDKYIRSWMGVPLTVKGEAIGMLALDHSEPSRYTERDADLVMTFANQAAIAIENARLYAEAQKLAVLQERQRLARELHDSVSQALYGISLGTHTARALAQEEEISRQRLSDTLEYTLNLASAGLAEMRALIFELRPESLEKEGLTGALTKQAAALQARHQLLVHTHVDEEPDIPIAVKEALFRVAQEAMNNVIKHAQAQTMEIRLFSEDGAVILEVQDDGVGFDPGESFPGHLGLQTMRERVARHRGVFEINSSPGGGTCLRVQVQVSPRSASDAHPD